MRVLIVDRKTASFIRKGLLESGFSVEHTADGHEGLTLALHNDYDTVILDLMLPSMSGLNVLQGMRNAGKQTPVLILSAKASVEDKVAGLRKGGDDYLTKPFSFNELLWRVQALIRRAGIQVPTTALKVHDLELDVLTRNVMRQGVSIELQPREFALLEHLMRNAGRVVSRTMIMEHVWNYNFDPETNVVESRMSRLRDKVDVPFSCPLIHTIRGVGYVIKAPA
jgi:two-component system OmpR family response regulator